MPSDNTTPAVKPSEEQMEWARETLKAISVRFDENYGMEDHIASRLAERERGQGERIERLEAALKKVHERAKTTRKSSQLVGPSEYERDHKAMTVWRKTMYQEGKELFELTRAALTPPTATEKDVK